jgi:hypothetical protein
VISGFEIFGNLIEVWHSDIMIENKHHMIWLFIQCHLSIFDDADYYWMDVHEQWEFDVSISRNSITLSLRHFDTFHNGFFSSKWLLVRLFEGCVRIVESRKSKDWKSEVMKLQDIQSRKNSVISDGRTWELWKRLAPWMTRSLRERNESAKESYCDWVWPEFWSNHSVSSDLFKMPFNLHKVCDVCRRSNRPFSIGESLIHQVRLGEKCRDNGRKWMAEMESVKDEHYDSAVQWSSELRLLVVDVVDFNSIWMTNVFLWISTIWLNTVDIHRVENAFRNEFCYGMHLIEIIKADSMYEQV